MLGPVERVRRRGLVRQGGRVLAPQRGHDARDDHREPVRARVHHARFLEHRQLLRPAFDRLLGGGQSPLEHLGDELVLLFRRGVGAEAGRVHMREILRHAVSHRAHRAEHGALRGVANGVVRGVGRARERRGNQHGVHQLAGARG